MKLRNSPLLSPMYSAFAFFSLISVLNIFVWPEAPGFFDWFIIFISASLANSTFSDLSNQGMSLAVVPAYLFVTTCINYAVALILKKPTVLRVVAFVLAFIVVSATIGVATSTIYFDRASAIAKTQIISSAH